MILTLSGLSRQDASNDVYNLILKGQDKIWPQVKVS